MDVDFRLLSCAFEVQQRPTCWIRICELELCSIPTWTLVIGDVRINRVHRVEAMRQFDFYPRIRIVVAVPPRFPGTAQTAPAILPIACKSPINCRLFDGLRGYVGELSRL